MVVGPGGRDHRGELDLLTAAGVVAVRMAPRCFALRPQQRLPWRTGRSHASMVVRLTGRITAPNRLAAVCNPQLQLRGRASTVEFRHRRPPAPRTLSCCAGARQRPFRPRPGCGLAGLSRPEPARIGGQPRGRGACQGNTVSLSRRGCPTWRYRAGHLRTGRHHRGGGTSRSRRTPCDAA